MTGVAEAAASLPPRLARALCLEFTNTAAARRAGRFDEYLGSYARLLTWALALDVLSPTDADVLADVARDEPNAAQAIYRHALSARETWYRVFSALAGNAQPTAADRQAVEHAARDALAHATLNPRDGCLAWSWPRPRTAYDLARPLLALAYSALELLTSPRLARVKECPGADGTPCSWLFVDLSKNASRRWCRMAECGSVAKARRQTTRRRAARQSA